MKFKSVITDQTCMKDFNNLMVTFSRLAKTAVCTIKESGLTILNEGAPIHGIPLIWANIQQSEFFSQYAMEGVDEEYNSICLSFNPGKLAGALGMLKGSVNFVKMKLTKKQFPCITVIIEVPSACNSNHRQIVHDVPVTIIPVRDWPEYQTPEVPPCQMTVTMPSLKSLRTLCDKMKNLSPTLTICCGLSGDLSFIVETDSAMVASRYYNLVVNQLEKRKNIDDADADEIAVRVDTKQLSHCFSSIQFQNIRMNGNIIQDEVFNILFVIRPNVTMNCVIYAVSV